MVMDSNKLGLPTESTKPRGVLQEKETAEYPAIDASGRIHSPPESVDLDIPVPHYEPVDLRPLETLQGFCSLRVVHARSGVVVQEAYSPSPADDIDDGLLSSLRELGRSPSFDSLGMVTREHLTLVHALRSRRGFICVLALKQAAGNFALAKVQIQRVFS